MTDQFVPVLDTSGWQAKYGGNGRLLAGAKPFDFRKAAALGVKGIIHRVGNGTTFDQSYPLAEQAAREAGLAFGAYYYFQPNSIGPGDAAILTQKWLSEYAPTDLPVMLDCEHYNGTQLDRDALGAYIQTYLTHIEIQHGRKPLVYSGAWWWNSRVAGDFTSYDSMQARYPRYGVRPPSNTADWDAWIPSSKTPLDCPGLGDWNGWQFTSDLHGPDFGVPSDAATKRLDGNIVREAAWQRWTSGVTPVPVPDPVKWPVFDPLNGKFSLWPLNIQKPLTVRGDQGDAVAYIQGVISHKAGGHIFIDGDFGPETERRVKDVQAQFTITQDGKVGWHGAGADPGPEATWPIIDFLASI